MLEYVPKKRKKVKLPVGISIVAEPPPADELNKMSLKKKSNIWYVLYLDPRKTTHEYGLSIPNVAWTHGQSKYHCKIIARNLEANGCTIVDIVFGSKTHVMNKYRGL